MTIAVILVRAGIESGSSAPRATPTSTPVAPRKHVVTTTTTSTTKKTSGGAKQYWTVKAGDTFGVISSQTGVPVATIEQLNPKVSSTALFIGEKIRIK